MGVSVFFEFNGNAAEALDYYKGIFGGEVYKLTYADMPAEEDFVVSEEQKKLVAYATLEVNGTLISFSDIIPGFGPEMTVGNNVTALYSTDKFEEGKKIFDALSKEGNVIMPFEKTSWAEGFGELCDRFGIQWKVNVDFR